MTTTNYVVATTKPWNIEAFHERSEDLPGNWHLISDKSGLNIKALEKLAPRFIFFPHWSWIVPDDVLTKFECVCFHMTDVPYGRGGSPLQNLIARGHEETKLTALRMTNKLDAGPVYLKSRLSLEGSAQQIFLRSASLTYDLIDRIISQLPTPRDQVGEVTEFARRTPDQSELPELASLKQIYDQIRMLDAETYPLAYINHGEFRLQFNKATLFADEVTASVTITKRDT